MFHVEHYFNRDVMKEELREQIKSDPTMQAQVLDVLKSTEVGKEYAKTIALNYYEENISKEHKRIYDFVDNSMIDAGLIKPEGMKTSEWTSMVAKQNAELTKQVEELKTGGSNEEIKTKLLDLKKKHRAEKEQLIQEAQNKLSEQETVIGTLKNQQSSLKRANIINKGISELKFRSEIDKALLNDIVELKMQALISNAVEEEGKTIWIKKDGTPYKDGLLNASIEFILKSELDSIIEKTTAGGGAGTATPSNGDFDGSKVIIQETSFTTQEGFLNEFEKIAQRKGIARGETFDNLYWEAFERYNISSLKEY